MQGRDIMRQASKAALRELLNEKRLVQWAPGQASPCVPGVQHLALKKPPQPLCPAGACPPEVAPCLQNESSCSAVHRLPHPLQAGQLELTHKGRAVYDSALPLEPAMRLYDSCSRAENGAPLWKPL